jgi:hypothetical protein
VLSELLREKPDVSVVHRMDRQPQSSICITSVTLMEIGYGLQSLPAGRRSARLMRELEDVLTQEIEERYASFDTAAAQQAASLMAARRQQGRPIEFRDTMIAGIVMSRQAILATRNTAHFSDLGSNVVNPWNP